MDLLEHKGLVHSIVWQHFRWAIRRCGYDDLVQAGMMGVMRAAEDYDPSRAAFGTYAYLWIRLFISRYANEAIGATRLPTDWAARTSTATKADIRRSLWAVQLSPEHDDELVDDRQDDLDRLTAQSVVHQALECLDDRKRKILLWRADGHTLEQVAELLASVEGVRLTRERIRQIEAKAIRDFRAFVQHFYPSYYSELVSHGRTWVPVQVQGHRDRRGRAKRVPKSLRKVQSGEGHQQDRKGNDGQELLPAASYVLASAQAGHRH